ncbi:MAG: ROK family transcriptional regulator [Ignavibacteriae bacterium]|nr:ROK family transcriptional regulator [Ignavibacteriota bacterium]
MQARRQKHEGITRINSKVARDINRSIILATVRRGQPIPRSEIAEITRLNKSTVSSIVARLIDEELLIESPDRIGAGTVGRKPVNLSLAQGKHFIGAISFDAPCTRVAIVDINGTLRARDEIWTKVVSPESLVAQSVARLNALRATIGPHRFHGIGASVGGIVDADQSRVIYSANLGWSNVDLSALIREQAPDVETISVENDAKASALAELLWGAHRISPANLVFLLVGVGIGAGITINGRVLSGDTHAAGEVGHMTVVEGGERCSCGNSGCWHLYASEQALIRWFTELKSAKPGFVPAVALSDVVDAARAGDDDALQALKTWAQHVGVGIGDLMCILDPSAVIVGGPITQVWDLVGETVNASAGGRRPLASQHKTTVLPTSLPDNPPLLGAAALSIRSVFADVTISM